MTEITDQDRHAARVWAKNWQGDQDDDTSAAARVILATVDAPPRTLAEELRDVADNYNYGMSSRAAERVDDIADRVEHELAEARAEVEQAEDRAAEWQGIAQRDYAKVELLTADLAEARAEVERLTAVNENLRRTDNYREFREQFLAVQKGAESNAESLDPADVKPGEAWLVECRGERRTAVKDNDDLNEPWNTVNADGWLLAEDDEDITPITRLVSAPRVITDPHDLDRLPRHTVILSADNDAWQKSSETSMWASAWWTTSDGEPSMWASDRLCDEDHPATVLWEPEA